MKRTLFILGMLASTACTIGCTVGPRYQRPATDTPQAFRAATAPNISSNAPSLGDEKWAEVFQDPALQRLIREALANNYDVKIAAQRVLEQQDQVGITRAQQFPTLNGGGTYTALGLPSSLRKSLSSSNSYSTASSYYAGGLTLSAAWNLDFWGLYRRQTEAARAQLLATEWGRRMTISTVVENVATAYFQLRTLDAELEITRQTLAARRQSLQLTQTLEQGGSGTLADVRQAEQLLYTAAAAIPDFERQIEQQENSISILLGRNPGPILRDRLRDELARAGAGSGRTPLGTVRTPAGYRAGRGGAACGECQCRSGQGADVPTALSLWNGGNIQQPAQGSGRW